MQVTVDSIPMPMWDLMYVRPEHSVWVVYNALKLSYMRVKLSLDDLKKTQQTK